MSDNCKSNVNVECAVEKRFMITMKIGEIHKLNVVRKITSAVLWVREGSLVNKSESERKRFRTLKKCWLGLCNEQLGLCNHQEMRKNNPRNGNNLECVIREMASTLNAYKSKY